MVQRRVSFKFLVGKALPNLSLNFHLSPSEVKRLTLREYLNYLEALDDLKQQARRG